MGWLYLFDKHFVPSMLFLKTGEPRFFNEISNQQGQCVLWGCIQECTGHPLLMNSQYTMMITIKGIKQAYRAGVHNELIIAKIVQYVTIWRAQKCQAKFRQPTRPRFNEVSMDQIGLNFLVQLQLTVFKEELMQRTGRLSISS